MDETKWVEPGTIGEVNKVAWGVPGKGTGRLSGLAARRVKREASRSGVQETSKKVDYKSKRENVIKEGAEHTTAYTYSRYGKYKG